MTDHRRNLVLTGFMGTGKSAVGHKVARELERPFVDMDAVIEERAGKSIPDIFAQDGEPVFRALERDLCAELAAKNGLIIATGGGAMVAPENRETLASSGCLICLDCEATELQYRLKGDGSRPMLWGQDQPQRVQQLLESRREAYAAIPHHVDTTYRSVDQVVDEVIRICATQPMIWNINTPTGPYSVYLEPGGMEGIGSRLRTQGVQSQVIVVSDENLWPLYGHRVLDGISQSGLPVTSIVLPAGERYKTLETVRTLYDKFIDAGLDRRGAVVAVGGGVITDMVGFAAASFMRGVPLVQAPTSLLGMVDASVGGKVAVDHPRGKNLIGAFVRPLFVMLDPDTLSTLPDIEYRSGLAEIIKAGIISDPGLFEAFESGPEQSDPRWMIERALQIKIDVVEEDPYEHGRRAVLNLGHTFAHAFEVLSDFQLHHGLAVSVGMVAAAHLAEIRGICSAEARARIVDTLQRHHMLTQWSTHAPAEAYKAMGADKKRVGSRLRFILPRNIGDVIIDGDVTEPQVLQALERIR